MKEEDSIKLMLLLFCGAYTLRIGFAVLFHVEEQWVYSLFSEKINLFSLIVFLLWSLWDAAPMLSMLIIHYKNFSSFKDENLEQSRFYMESCFSLDPNAENDAVHQEGQTIETNSVL